MGLGLLAATSALAEVEYLPGPVHGQAAQALVLADHGPQQRGQSVYGPARGELVPRQFSSPQLEIVSARAPIIGWGKLSLPRAL